MKETLRRAWKETLLAMSREESSVKSKLVLQRVRSHPSVQKASRFMVYAPLAHEVDTTSFLNELLASGKSLYLPKIEGEQLLVARVHALSDLAPGPLGALEVVDSTEILNPSELQVVLVPGLVFDQNGYRIGSGKGFYDRFLKTTPALRIGLAFSEQVLEEIPHDAHDVPMHWIATDTSLIHPLSSTL